MDRCCYLLLHCVTKYLAGFEHYMLCVHTDLALKGRCPQEVRLDHTNCVAVLLHGSSCRLYAFPRLGQDYLEVSKHLLPFKLQTVNTALILTISEAQTERHFSDKKILTLMFS